MSRTLLHALSFEHRSIGWALLIFFSLSLTLLRCTSSPSICFGKSIKSPFGFSFSTISWLGSGLHCFNSMNVFPMSLVINCSRLPIKIWALIYSFSFYLIPLMRWHLSSLILHFVNFDSLSMDLDLSEWLLNLLKLELINADSYLMLILLIWALSKTQIL